MLKGRMVQIIVLGFVAFTAGVVLRFSGSPPDSKIASPITIVGERAGELASAQEESPPLPPAPSALTTETSELKAPSNIVVPRDFNPFEDFLLVVGRAEPNSIVNITLTKQGEKPVKFNVNVEANGEWEAYEKIYLSPGEWELRARAQLDNKVSDWSSAKVIKSIKAGVDLFGLKIRYVPLAAVLFVFLIAGGALVFYFLHRIQKLKRGLFEKQIRETQERFRENFSEIRRDLTDELRTLAENAQNRALTPDEITRREHLLRELDRIERQLSQEMGEIERRY